LHIEDDVSALQKWPRRLIANAYADLAENKPFGVSTPGNCVFHAIWDKGLSD
jgi:hypothetical protein